MLEAKLRIDAEAIGKEEERVWYGFGCLTGTASQRIHPWIEFAKNTDQFTVKGFFDRLDKAFEDTEKITKAIDRLNCIRQGNRCFREFLQEFEQIVLEAQGWGWDDTFKKGFLRAALNRELCDRLVSQNVPDGYEDFVTQLRMTSDKMEAIKTWNDRRNRNRGIYPQSTHSQDTTSRADPMEWEPTQSVNIAATMHPRVCQSSHSNPKRATWVSHDEIGRRISEGLCIRCGGQNHRIKECSLLPAINPNRQGNRNIQNPRVSAVGLPVNQGADEVSENA